MAEYWEVVYRAVGDFGDLLAKAAAAKAAFKDMQDAARAESAEEVKGQTEATAARKADSAAIRQEIADLAALKAAAQQSNQQVAWGGRNSPDQHLQDLDRELNYRNLLNRANWMNFSSPQQAYSFQQQQLTLKRQMNYAEWAGYTTPDQYLGFLARQQAALQQGNSVMLARAEIYRELAAAALAYDNALHGTHKSLGELDQTSTVSNLATELGALPGEIRTKLVVDDAEALARIAADRAALAAIPRVITTVEVAQNGGNNLGNDQSLGFAAQLAQLAAMRNGSDRALPNMASQNTLQDEVRAYWAQMLRQRMTRTPNWNPTVMPGSGMGSGGGSPPPFTPVPAASGGDDRWENQLEAVIAGLEKASLAEKAFNAIPPPPDAAYNAAFAAMAGGADEVKDAFGDASHGAEDFGDTISGKVLGDAEDFMDTLRAMADRLREFGNADSEVAMFLQNTMAHLQSLNVTSSDDASRLAYAISYLGKIDPNSLSQFNSQAKATILSIVNLVGQTSSIKNAAQSVYGAFQLYKAGLTGVAQGADRLATSGLVDLSQGFYKASTAADAAAHVIAQAGSSFLGWSSRFELWGGKFGENHFSGAIAGWHLWLDAIVEFSAVSIPALAAGVIGLGAFAYAVATAGNTMKAMVGNIMAMYTVSKATDSFLGPFTDHMDKLQSSIQPKAWELAGDAMLVVNKNTGTLGVIANRVGQDLDNLAAKMTNKIVNGNGKEFLNFFNLGAQDIHKFASLFGAVGSIFDSLVKASQETQVAERLLTGLGAVVGVVAKVIGSIPTPLLAAAIGIHSFLVYGGLLTTWAQRAALGFAGLVARIPGMSGAMLSFGQAIGGSTAQLENMATKSAALNTIAAELGTTSLEAARMQAYIASTGMTMEEFANQTNAGRQLIAQYAAGLDDTGRQAVITGVALGGTEAQIAKIADAQHGTAIMGVAKAFGITAQGAEELAQQVEAAGWSVQGLAKQAPNGADLLDKYGKGLSQAGQDAVGLGVVLGGTNDQLETVAKTAAESESKVSLFGKAMTGVGGFLSANWLTIALAAAAAFGYIADKALSASSGVASFLGNLKSSLASASGAALLVDIPQTLGQIQLQIAKTNAAWAQSSPSIHALTGSWDNFFQHWRHGFDQAFADVGGLFGAHITANPDLGALQGQLESELKTYGALTTTIDGLTKQGYNFTQSLGVLSAAGVQVGDTLGVMQTKVDALLQGYKLAGQQTGALGSDMDALTVSSSSVVAQMGKLNQAWDTWTQTVAAPIGSFLTLNQSMQQFATDSKAAGANLSGLGRVTADTAGSLGANATTLQTDFQTVFGNVESLFDAVRSSEATFAGSGGIGAQFTKTVKDSVAALLPLAGTNKQAAAEVSALAQEAGGPATTNLKELAKWAGNVHDPMKALQGITNQAAVAASNLSQDAAQLTTTIQQELVPQMAASIIAASKAGPSMQAFATAVFSGHDSVKQLTPSAEQLYGTLLKVSGNAANAKALFVGFAESMGLSKQKADTLWAQVAKPIKPKVDNTEADQKLTQMYNHMLQASTPPPPGGWAGFWQQVSMDFTSWIWHPLDTFFNHTLESWYNTSNAALSESWKEAKQAFDNFFSNPIDTFFNHTIESWYRIAVNGAHTMWSQIANFFTADVADPVDNFFTKGIGGYFHTGYEAFLKDFGDPMIKWFSESLPAGLRAGLNWAIDNTINKFIGVVNHDLLGWIPGGIHIPTFQNVASGGIIGSVPGTGDEDGTHAVMMGGEWVLRKPARMALQARYGPNFLPTLNQADTWLGSGSRGNAASQMGAASGRYAGGGIIGGIESAISGGASWLEGIAGWSASELSHIPGISSLMGLAKGGLGSLVGGAWDAMVNPLVNAVQNPFAHDMADATSTAMKDTIQKVMGVKQAAGTAAVGSAGLGSGNIRTEELYALSQFPRYNWNSGQLPPLISLWNKESGWNANAVNPTSGAYGIPQALGKGHPYNLGDWRSQINWGLQYVDERYGDPSGAWAHEAANNWYAGGGPVISAILDRTGNTRIREAMALGSWIESRWKDTAASSRTTEYGPYQIGLRDNKGVTKTNAENPVWATHFAFPYYQQGVDRVSGNLWASNPADAAQQAALRAQSAFGSVLDPLGTGVLKEGWADVREVLGFPPATASSGSKGSNQVQKFNGYMSEATKQLAVARRDWGTLSGRRKPGHSADTLESMAEVSIRKAASLSLESEAAQKKANTYTVDADKSSGAQKRKYQLDAAAQIALAVKDRQQAASQLKASVKDKQEVAVWERWAADKMIEGVGESQVTSAFNALGGKNPASMTNADWSTLRIDLDYWHGIAEGNVAPKSKWGAERGGSWPAGYKAGDITPSDEAAREWFGGARATNQAAVTKLQQEVGQAYNIWHSNWGDRLTTTRGTPGVSVNNPSNPGPTSINLGPLEYGGPKGGGNVGPGGFGFASGGPVDVAAMFASGGAVPMPSFVMPGMSATLQKQLSGAAQQQLPRTMGDAAGENVGMKVGQLTINNPVAEAPSTSIARAGNRMAFLAGRGPV